MNREPLTVNHQPFDATRYTRFFEHPHIGPEACDFLFAQRRLDPRVIRWCRLTSWTDKHGIPWLQIPYFDPDGSLVGIQNRNLISSAKGQVSDSKVHSQPLNMNPAPRFRFPQGSRCSIYNLPVLRLLHEGEPLWIAEGASDCWALLSAGHKAIAIPSATLLTNEDKDILLSLSSSLSLNFHMAPDQDLPGEQLFLRLQALLPNLTRHQLPKGCKDYAEYYVKFKI